MKNMRIVELMQVPEDEHDLCWLRQTLQAAVELELSTLPPYLCGLWSIKNPSDRNSQEAYNLILSVIMEEMLHMGLACNMLTGVGGTPLIYSACSVPTYPGPLPGGVIPSLTVYLAGLTPTYVQNIYMVIEHPENPVALAAATYPTIGAFYTAISDAFSALKPAMSTTRQMQTTIYMPDGSTEALPLIQSYTDAVNAINEIKEQGEGTSSSPDAVDFGGELAHYYRFGEIFYGHQLIQQNGQWVWQGPAVPFPDCWPVAQVPPGGYSESQAPGTDAFNLQFSKVLYHLQVAWTTGNPNELNTAINCMMKLSGLAQPLMQMAIPGGSGNYGPSFILVDIGSSGAQDTCT